MPTEVTETPEQATITTSRWLIVAFRILLLAAAAGAVAVAAAIELRDRSADDAGVRYVCPMHPEVRSATPGQCPICGMALERVGRSAAEGAGEGQGVAATADMTAVDNVRKHKTVDFVRMKSLPPDLRELRGAGWVEDDGVITAIFYNDQIASLASDEPGTFSRSAAPAVRFAVHRTADPVVAWDRSGSRIRFAFDRAGQPASPDEAPRAGQVGWVELARKRREVLAVPASAVVQSPEGPYVLRSLGGFRFEKRPIVIGETFDKQGFAIVLSGLRAQDRVVSKATFFFDADRRLANAAGAEEGGRVAP